MKDKVNLIYNIVQIAPISKFTHHTEELIQQETFYCPCRWGRILYSALKLDFPGLIPNSEHKTIIACLPPSPASCRCSPGMYNRMCAHLEALRRGAKMRKSRPQCQAELQLWLGGWSCTSRPQNPCHCQAGVATRPNTSLLEWAGKPWCE